MPISTNNSITPAAGGSAQRVSPPELTALHKRGVHFVLTKDKIAFQPGWQLHPPSLEAVQEHAKDGGQFGFIPGRSGLWVLDVDKFPGEDKDTGELLANVEPLAVVNTRRGRHVYFKKAGRKIITNRQWSTGGFSGEFRGDNGYCVAWELDKLAVALDKFPDASATSPALFPPPPPKAKTPAKGFVKGNRTDHLNKVVFAEEMRGQTDHSEVIEEALAAGLPAEKITKGNVKTIADADVTKARTFDRKDASALESALAALGITVRYNLRAMCPELSNGGGAWTKTTDRSSAELRRRIADRFSYHLAGDRGSAPLRFGMESWSENLNALLHHLEVDPFRAWLDEAVPKWDGTKRLGNLLVHLLGATDGPLTRWAGNYLCLGAIQRTLEPGCLLREIPILIGPQRIGKSQLLSNLLPPDRPDWFSDSLCVSDPSQKRAESMLGRVVVELSELTGFGRAELESLKAFISRRDDGATRLAYRRDPETALRRCILVGTSNDQECLPADPSGNTRYVPIQCGEGSHVEPYLDEYRGQLWAEGLALYNKGERANLPRELMTLQAQHGEIHRRKDQVLEDAVAALDGVGPYTMGELFRMACPGMAASDRRAVARLADAARLAGWSKRRERTASGGRAYLWRLTG